MAQISSNKPVRLIINADICDARRVREENYEMYEAIIINSELMIVNEQSKGILNRMGVSINSDNTIELPDGEEMDPVLQTITGPFTISAGMVFAPHTMLSIDGPLTIEKGSGDVMKNIDKIKLTGPLTRPQSIGGMMPPMSHNGPTTVYPDDCILLDSCFTVDKFFALRAREGARYYSKTRIFFSNDADMAKLLEKKVFFLTDKLILHESQAETVAQISDERAEFVVLPDKMAYFDDDVRLDESFLNIHGGSICVDGDLTFDPGADGDALCRRIECLIVHGTVEISKNQEYAFKNLHNVEYEELKVNEKNGRHRINDLAKLYLDRNTLENYPEGVEISDIASLTIDPEIPIELIYERLSIEDVAYIRCATNQAGAIGAVSRDVASIRGVPAAELTGRKQDSGLVNGIMNGVINGLFGKPDWGDGQEETEEDIAVNDEEPAQPSQDQGIRLINADKYIM